MGEDGSRSIQTLARRRRPRRCGKHVGKRSEQAKTVEGDPRADAHTETGTVCDKIPPTQSLLGLKRAACRNPRRFKALPAQSIIPVVGKRLRRHSVAAGRWTNSHRWANPDLLTVNGYSPSRTAALLVHNSARISRAASGLVAATSSVRWMRRRCVVTAKDLTQWMEQRVGFSQKSQTNSPRRISPGSGQLRFLNRNHRCSGR